MRSSNNNKYMRTFATALFILLSFTPILFVQAQSTGSNTGTTLLNPLSGVDCSRGNGNCLSAFLLNVLDFIITIGSIVVILMLVYVGLKFVTAQGSDTKISEARTMLLWTVIGALILLGSQAIAEGIKATANALRP